MTNLTPTQNDLFQEIARKIGERAFWEAPETSEEIEQIIREYPEADIRRAMLTMKEPRPWPGNLRKQLGSAGRANNGVVPDHLRYVDATSSQWFTHEQEDTERWGCLTCGKRFEHRADASKCGRSHGTEDMTGQEWLAVRDSFGLDSTLARQMLNDQRGPRSPER